MAPPGGALLTTLQQKIDNNVVASQLDTIWRALLRIVSALRINLHKAAQENLKKTQSRWPPVREFVPLFDDDFDEEEQLPRTLDVGFRQIERGDKQVVLLHCNGLNLGDRLTDNIDHPDFYQIPRYLSSRSRRVPRMVANNARPSELQA